MYADDTSLLFLDISWEKLQQKSIKYLNKVINWINNTKLSFNFYKIIFMIFSINQTDLPFKEMTIHKCTKYI